MVNTVIEVEDLGIFFKIYHKKGLSKKDAFLSYGKDMLNRIVRPRRVQSGPEVFWALRNVSFTVGKGEVIGVIGENGSGKSTLLKTIAGIFRPDEGRVSAKGKVGALIELGAGFHPELSGRDNIYLNGSVLGMKRRQIDRIFNDIVGFSELEEFIDTPIKNYSSGMKVRLGFSVAIHLDPDILLVDEVLAVGDMAFRMKCLDKMNEFRKRGVTILFVSHDLTTVRSFCERVMLLSRGALLEYGPPSDVTNRYFKMVIEGKRKSERTTPSLSGVDSIGNEAEDTAATSVFTGSPEFQKRASSQRIQNGKASFTNIQLLDELEREVASVEYGQEVTLRMAVEIYEDIPLLGYGYHIRNRNGVSIVYSDSLIENSDLRDLKRGDRYVIDWRFTCSLSADTYHFLCALSIPVEVSIGKVDYCDFIPVALQFRVGIRPRSQLYGSVHWSNEVTTTKY